LAAGLHAYLQVAYVHMAARNTGEYVLLGGLVLLGWALAWLQLRQWLGLNVYTCIEQSLLRLLALAFLVTSAGLAINGRYLDFPLILVCLPLMLITISLISTKEIEQPVAVFNQTGFWLTAIMGVMAANMAVAVAMMEPGNIMAWWWCGSCGLALFVLPARSLQLGR
jgi:hypothetical protein